MTDEERDELDRATAKLISAISCATLFIAFLSFYVGYLAGAK